MRGRLREEEEAEESEEEEEESRGVLVGTKKLTIETAGTEEETADGLDVALGMEVKKDRDSEGEEGGEGTQRALVALEFLTQNA